MSKSRKSPGGSARKRRAKKALSEEPGGLPQYVTPLTPIEMQVGGHVITALRHPGTVAVLSTVAMGPDGQQRLVSVGLSEEVLGHVQSMLREADTKRADRIPCVGFHCYVDDPDDLEELDPGARIEGDAEEGEPAS